MFVILAIIAGLFLFGKFQFNLSAASATPIQNATGASLTAALGRVSNPPSYYATGNPGYNAQPTGAPAPVIAAPVQPTVAAHPSQPVVNPSTTQIATLTRGGAPNKYAPPLIQPTNVRTRIVGPEQATAFWSKTATTIRRPSQA